MDEAGGELIGLLVAAAIVIAIIVIVIAAIIFVGIFLLAGIALFGTASGMFIGTRNFFAILKEAHRDVPRGRVPVSVPAGAPSPTSTDEQPAYLLYPKDRGWRVMTYVRSNLFARTANEAKGWFTRGAALRAQSSAATENVQQYWLLSAAGGFYLAGLAQFLAAHIIVALFMVVHVVILAMWYAVSTTGIFFIGLYTKAYGNWYRAHYRCPGCHESMEIPVFMCPTCATDHTRLWPSEYGVLHHTCSKCETELPTTDRNGRTALARKCPYCSRPLNADIGLLTNVHIPLVGGPSSGKSNLIVMATNELIHSTKALGGATFTFPDPVDEREFQASMQRLQGGLELVKTPNVVPQAFNLSIKRPRERVGKVVYFYDAAGEAYGDEASALQQSTYYEYVHGLIFVVDPFCIPSVRAELDTRLDAVQTALRPSQIGVMESYERMLAVLEASVGLKRGEQFPHPLAVVLTKVDAFNLEAKVGMPAARDLEADNPKYKSDGDAIDFLVRRFLGEHRLDHFVRDAEHQFQQVRFFSCSALGRMPNPANTSAFTPVRVVEPLAWVLEELDVLSAINVAAPAAVPVQAATATS